MGSRTPSARALTACDASWCEQAPITSVEWSPSESSTVAVAGADNQLTLWDLALEEDPEAENAVIGRDDLADIPPQLYFVHQGQAEIKEIHWHAQVSTCARSAAARLAVKRPLDHHCARSITTAHTHALLLLLLLLLLL